MIAAAQTTLAVWKRLQAKDRARTLAANRFVDFTNGPKDDWRRRTSDAIRQGSKLDKEKLTAWRSFALSIAEQSPESDRLIFAKLQSRLMVNMAGGVFENGGICLDHASGVPFIPGSAVKGCARRMAVQELLELATQSETTDINACASHLTNTCLIFGWGDEEWKSDRRQPKQGKSPDKTEHYSDLAFACGQHWPAIRQATAIALCAHLGITPKKSDSPWESLPHFAGTIAFLPAYPWERDPGIDLDIITSHHKAYYESKDHKAVALDTEEPVPIVFPAVSAANQPVFAFLLQPSPRAGASHLNSARKWLSNGLESFGIGAKTSAGYGWFLPAPEFAKTYAAKLTNEQAEKQRLLDEARARETAENKRKAQAELDAKLANLTPEEKADTLLAALTESQFDSKVRAFCKEPRRGGPADSEKQAIVRALRGPQLAYWQTFKTKATKGDLATIAQAIGTLSKTMNLGKMP